MADDCIFCRIVAGHAPASIVAETPEAVAFMDINQMTEGHVLIVPREHVRDIYELDAELTEAVFGLAVDVAKAVKGALGCDGLNLWQSNGRAAQQEVFHFHVHVIARYEGDRDRIRVSWTPKIQTHAELDRLAEAIQSKMSV